MVVLKVPGSCEVYVMIKKNKKTNTGQLDLKGKDDDVVVHTSNPVFGKQANKRAESSDCLSSIPANLQTQGNCKDVEIGAS